MTKSVYPHLLSPIEVSGHTLKNRSIMGSMHTGLEEAKNGFEKMAAFYKERAEGGAGLIITGGIAPHWRGWVAPFSGKMTNESDARRHRIVTDAVHSVDGKIAMQILHAGRYSYQPFPAAPSAIKSPISPFKPFKLTTRGVRTTVKHFVRCAQLAQNAGYDGVEIMGSEGYLINQFLVERTNRRSDIYGGDFAGRSRFAKEIVSGIRRAVGDRFIIVFRLSMLDLVEKGSTWQEVVSLARDLESEGVSIINTGIGWHEARIPTIATCVPRAAFSWVTEKMRKEIKVPLAAVNRINTPEIAEDILARDVADFVTMARPFLADSEFMKKAAEGRSEMINTCIACNQACLDHVFKQKRASCLVNPRACYETEYPITKLDTPLEVAVIGAGPAGMAAAVYAAERGARVTLFESRDRVGGQFHYAKKIPGKEEFNETIRYFNNRLQELKVDVKLSTKVRLDSAFLEKYDQVLVASGVVPRELRVEGHQRDHVIPYDQAILNPEKVGKRVAVIGSGGIGIDFSSLLVAKNHRALSTDSEEFSDYWGIDRSIKSPGGLSEVKPRSGETQVIKVFQRSEGRPGKGLGKTTAWIHRAHLKKEGVEFLAGVEYEKVDEKGLHYKQGEQSFVFECDTVVVCAGQVSERLNYAEFEGHENVSIVGGAKDASGIDAKRAIREAFQWASSL